MAKWSTKYKNDLPDSAFLYVGEGGALRYGERSRGEDPKGHYTIPKTLRKLPYRDKRGNVSQAHLANAYARLSAGSVDIPAAERRHLLRQIEKMADSSTRLSRNGVPEVVIRALPADLMEEFGAVEFPPYSHTPQAVEVYQKIQRGEGVDSNELLAAAGQLHHHGYRKLAARLTSLAKDPPSELLGVDATPTINMRLTAEELDGLGWIANRYESGRLLYGAYDDEAGTFEVDEVIAAYRATAGDGGDLGTVPNAGGSLAKKIDLLFDKSGAYWMEDDE